MRQNNQSEQRHLFFNQFEAKPTDYARSSALDTDCMFSRAWHRLHVFLLLALDLASEDVFPRLAPHLPDDVFPRLARIACFVHRLRHLAFVSDVVSFAFSFIASVKTELFLLLCKNNVLEKLYGLSCFPQLLACCSLLL